MKVTKKVVYSIEDFELNFEPIEDSIKIEKTKEGYTVKYLIREYDPESPRNWDNLGNMLCFHKRYNLGDDTDLNSDMFNGWEEVESYLIKEKKAVVILPLFLYDHSGISMRTYRHGHHAAWDCGQVGFIYATEEDIKKEYNVKRITKKIKDKVTNILEAEIDTYDKYLQGDIYCLVKETYNENKENINYDTLRGFYGYEDSLKKLWSVRYKNILLET